MKNLVSRVVDFDDSTSFITKHPKISAALTAVYFVGPVELLRRASKANSEKKLSQFMEKLVRL